MRICRFTGLGPLFSLAIAYVDGINYAQDGLYFTNAARLDVDKGFFGAAAPPPLPPARPVPPPPPARPQPQPASDALWSSCQNKGCSLAWAMHTADSFVGPFYQPSRSSAASPYQNPSDLATWFWSAFPPDRIDPNFHDFYGTWGIGWALADLGINAYSFAYEGGKNQLFFLDHESFHPRAPRVNKQKYQVDETWYRATGASYAFTINWDDGVIMGLNRKSPRYAGKERRPPVQGDGLPGLNQFSDVAWIGWQTVAAREHTDIKGLKYFVSVGIDNEETKAVVARALGQRGWTLDAWPGSVFESEWMETRALMGTPNLQGFAYFLIQHKAQLGNMFIDRLQVFHGETRHKNPCIVMHLSQPRVEKPAEPEKAAEVVRRVEGIVRTHIVHAKL